MVGAHHVFCCAVLRGGVGAVASLLGSPEAEDTVEDFIGVLDDVLTVIFEDEFVTTRGENEDLGDPHFVFYLFTPFVVM